MTLDRNFMKRLLIIVLLLFASSAWAEPIDDAAAANARGDYAAVLKIIRPLAASCVVTMTPTASATSVTWAVSPTTTVTCSKSKTGTQNEAVAASAAPPSTGDVCTGLDRWGPAYQTEANCGEKTWTSAPDGSYCCK